MPRRSSHSSSTEQTAIDFDAPIPAPGAAEAQERVAETPPDYSIAPAWIDTAGRTRTWSLKDPTGTQLAEITTKSAARKLADLLSRVMDDERGPSR